MTVKNVKLSDNDRMILGWGLPAIEAARARHMQALSSIPDFEYNEQYDSESVALREEYEEGLRLHIGQLTQTIDLIKAMI
jgi:hypothetical protein